MDILTSYFEAKQKVGYYSLILDECRSKIRQDPVESLGSLARRYKDLGLEHDLCFEFIGDAVLHLVDNQKALEQVEQDQDICRMKAEIGMTAQYYEQMKSRALNFWKQEMQGMEDNCEKAGKDNRS